MADTSFQMAFDPEPNPSVPPLVADAFVIQARLHGADFRYEMNSIVTRLESFLSSSLFEDADARFEVTPLNTQFDILSGAAAFIGQTLVREHDGLWTGYFAPDSGTNFYTATITFGEYSLHPICWLSYRLTNGVAEGTVSDWLGRVLPSIIARKDLTPKTGIITDIY